MVYWDVDKIKLDALIYIFVLVLCMFLYVLSQYCCDTLIEQQVMAYSLVCACMLGTPCGVVSIGRLSFGGARTKGHHQPKAEPGEADPRGPQPLSSSEQGLYFYIRT